MVQGAVVNGTSGELGRMDSKGKAKVDRGWRGRGRGRGRRKWRRGR